MEPTSRERTASNDQPAVYSTASTLDTGFGVDRTPTGWPTSGNVTAFTGTD